MEQSELVILAEEAIDEYFMNIDNMVDGIINNIIEAYGLDGKDLSEDDKKFLKKKIMRGILKWDEDKK